MSDGPVYMPGSIGASQPGVTQYILDNDDILQSIRAYLLRGKDGESQLVEYRDDAVAWFMNHLQVALSKVTLLSNLQNEPDLLRAEWSMFRMFLFDLLTRTPKYNFTDAQILELSSLYFNYVDRALHSTVSPKLITHKGFLSTTTSEQTSSVQQRITEEQNRGGVLGGLFGGRK